MHGLGLLPAHFTVTTSHMGTHTACTFLASIGGIVVGEITNSPTVTWAMVFLALISMFTLWIRSYYSYLQAQLRSDRYMRQLKDEVAELRIWKEAAGCLHFDCPNRSLPGHLPDPELRYKKPNGINQDKPDNGDDHATKTPHSS